MTDDKARDKIRLDLENGIYEATAVFEGLEHAGLIRGNGHHLRQEAARLVAELLDSRWVEGRGE